MLCPAIHTEPRTSVVLPVLLPHDMITSRLQAIQMRGCEYKSPTIAWNEICRPLFLFRAAYALPSDLFIDADRWAELVLAVVRVLCAMVSSFQ